MLKAQESNDTFTYVCFFILRVQCYVLCSGLLLYSKFCCKILPAKYYDLRFEIYFCLDNDNSLLLES